MKDPLVRFSVAIGGELLRRFDRYREEHKYPNRSEAVRGLMRSALGTVMRGMGGNPRAVARAGWSLLRLRVAVYALAGVFGVLSGLALLGLTTSGDANLAGRYTLLSIAAVILGGGEFTGGRVSPSGAVLGALTLTLAASLLTFLNIPPDWQIGVQGGILIAVLGLRAVIERIGRAEALA